MAPQITETIAALGADDRLVGRSDWCTRPPSVTALPSLGSALTPDLERIVGVRPTLVLVEASPSARIADLSALAPLEALPWLTFDDLLASTRRLGELSGRTAQAERWIAAFDAALEPDPPATGPSVLLALGGFDRGTVAFLKRNSLHGAALHAAGARNAVDRDVEGFPSLPVEEVLRLDPDAIILLAADPLGDEERVSRIAEWDALSPLRAVREHHVAVLGGPELLATGPTLTTLADTLRTTLAGLGVR